MVGQTMTRIGLNVRLKLLGIWKVLRYSSGN